MKSKVLFSIFSFFFILDSFSQNCTVTDENREEITKYSNENEFIAHIVVHRNRKRTYDATVSFVSPNVIIGAGHSFRERWYTKIKKIELIIGQRNGDGINTYIFKQTFKRDEIKVWVDKKFQRSSNPDFDYGMISLNKNIVNQYFKLNTLENLKTKADIVKINGYPGDKGNDELWTKYTNMENVIVKTHILLHDMYTFTGDSGAPIWIKTDSNNYHLVGVHGTGNYRNGTCNAGIKLTNQRISVIKRFINENSL